MMRPIVGTVIALAMIMIGASLVIVNSHSPAWAVVASRPAAVGVILAVGGGSLLGAAVRDYVT